MRDFEQPTPTDWWATLDLGASIPDPDYSLVDLTPTLGDIMAGEFGDQCRNALARKTLN